MASRVPMNSMWATPMLVTMATSGCASCASGAISPGWFMPDFPDGDFVVLARLQHRARETDMVVEVAFRFGDPETAAENGGGEIFRARFAVASGDGDDFYA